jgi:hypothetical protein
MVDSDVSSSTFANPVQVNGALTVSGAEYFGPASAAVATTTYPTLQYSSGSPNVFVITMAQNQAFALQNSLGNVMIGTTHVSAGNDNLNLTSAGSGSVNITIPSANIMAFGNKYAQFQTGVNVVFTAGTKVTQYNGVNTAGYGVPAIYAVVSTGSAVSLTTGSTAILSLASSLATGVYEITAGVTSVAATITGTIVISYADATTSNATTQTIAVPSTSSNISFSASALINAATGTAISVTGTASTSNDLKAIACIKQVA